MVESDLAAVRRPGERSHVEAVSPGQPARLGSLADVGHPEVGHAEVRVFDGVVPVGLLALLEVVGSGVGGDERDPGSVRREAEGVDPALVGGELLGLAALRANEVDLRAVTTVREEPEPGPVRRPPRSGAVPVLRPGQRERLATGGGQPDLPVEPVVLPVGRGDGEGDHAPVGRDPRTARRVQRDLGLERFHDRGRFLGAGDPGKECGCRQDQERTSAHDFSPSKRWVTVGLPMVSVNGGSAGLQAGTARHRRADDASPIVLVVRPAGSAGLWPASRWL